MDLAGGSDRVSLPAGQDMFALARELYPICRSITGDGTRETLRRLARLVPLEIFDVPSGTEVYDWVIPKEWNIRDAYVSDIHGRRVIDFQSHNLHLMGYSVPFKGRLSLAELKKHVHSLPEHPDWIPYRTTYYQENWGFCVSHRELLSMTDDTYEVVIDSSLEDGNLCWGEYVLPGETEEEILISTHICHPSLANDNLSGMVVASFLSKVLRDLQRRYTYRFLFTPATIGTINWLARNESTVVPRIRHGIVLSCVGDRAQLTYKRSRQGDAPIDRAFGYLLAGNGRIRDFSPYGYDERQFCSPGFNLPVGSLMRSPNGEYPEYHTSADNLEVICADSLEGTLSMCLRVFDLLESNLTYVNTNPRCEPRLGKRGLVGGSAGEGHLEGFLWLLSLSDGRHTLLDIAEKSRLPYDVLIRLAHSLHRHGLLVEAPGAAKSSGS